MDTVPAKPHSAPFLDSPAASDYIEQMGLVLGADGMPRIAGRIFGLLLLATDPLSLDDMVRLLRVSKASVSQETRRLAQRGLLERASRPGDRRDYYRLRPNLVANLLETRLRRWRAVQQATVQASRTLEHAPTQISARLDELATGLAHSIDTLSASLDAWRKARP